MKDSAMELTAKRLRELLAYDAETGVFTRLKRTSQKDRTGEVAGGQNLNGYTVISVDGKQHYAHRLAMLYVVGSIPTMVDHLNGNKSDNRFVNLRVADATVNQQNIRHAQRNNKSGFLGVTRHGKRFAAKIMKDRKRITIGVFDRPEEAHQAYVLAKRELHANSCTI